MLEPTQPTVTVHRRDDRQYYVINVDGANRGEVGPFDTDMEAMKAGQRELKLLQRNR